MRLGLVVDVVPNDDVVHSGGDGSTHGEHQPRIEGFLQHLTDLATFGIVRQVRKPNCTGKLHARMWVVLLHSNMTHGRHSTKTYNIHHHHHHMVFLGWPKQQRHHEDHYSQSKYSSIGQCCNSSGISMYSNGAGGLTVTERR